MKLLRFQIIQLKFQNQPRILWEIRFVLFKEDLKRQFVLEKKHTPQGKINLIMNRTSEDVAISGINGLELNPDLD